jgi:hypothetical protein
MRAALPVARVAFVVQHVGHAYDLFQHGAVAGGQHGGVELVGGAVGEHRPPSDMQRGSALRQRRLSPKPFIASVLHVKFFHLDVGAPGPS